MVAFSQTSLKTTLTIDAATHTTQPGDMDEKANQ